MQANEEFKMEEGLEDITGITCIYVPVNDVYESIKWYQKNLGYQPATNDRVEPGMVMAVLNLLTLTVTYGKFGSLNRLIRSISLT
ncbi:hypothetical protein [Paenibacillus sp. HGF5]|uniref:hypothetical protein n=1 Tax=Paenibacillus sp. HGF5 TaxID=908341 RepID=UPI0002072D8F|nr:hypothetical protein [Paenibacillus sp. HGF5]EGG34700.1 hypothetical protein HMPREF9412_1485 [Paenibacillus sp. HGF5]